MDKELNRKLRLRATLFSCHEKTSESINDSILKTILKDSFIHFHTYLCDFPVLKINCKEYPQLINPFVDNDLIKTKMTLDYELGNQKSKLKLINEVLKFAKINKFDISLKLTLKSNVFNFWESYHSLGTIKCGHFSALIFENWKKDIELLSGIKYKPVSPNDCIDDIKSKLLSEISIEQKLAYINLFSIQYNNVINSSNKKDCLFFIPVPICTSNTFYGIIITTIEVPNGIEILKKNKKELDDIFITISSIINEHSEETYLPTLALTQNSWEEVLFNDFLSTKKNISKDELNEELKKPGYKYACWGQKTNLMIKHSANEQLEFKFSTLWFNRINKLNTCSSEIAVVKNSLKFRKMMIASPGLISVIRKITNLNIKATTEPPIPSILIYAPPGAGKENISKIVPLFSDFWDKTKITLNMGSIISETEGSGSIKGIFQSIKNNINDGAIIVLDELNSLDIYEQPILLRILEQGEIAKIDEIKEMDSENKVPQWLIIGIINEKPEHLTLESLREQFLDEKIYGGLLGITIYDHIKSKSRLRDDIYYRIKRSGELILEGLNNRREDIPIIFYFMLKKFLEEDVIKNEIFITIDAFKELIDKTVDWKGNVRRLESLVRLVKSNINAKNSEIIVIEKNDIQKGFEMLWKKQI